MIASPNVSQSQCAPSLLGTWRLVSFEARGSKGQLQYPLGQDVSGLLVYDAAGNMSAHVTRKERPLFAANDPECGTDTEVRAAFEGHASYFGTYAIDLARQTVTHHVRVHRTPIGLAAISFVISSSTALGCCCPRLRSYSVANHWSMWRFGNASHEAEVGVKSNTA